MRPHWLLAVLAAAPLACNNDDATVTDAAVAVDVPAVTDQPVVTDRGADVPRDVGVDAGATALFAPCTTVSSCRGITSARCLTVDDGYPQGLCTRPCTNDSGCPDGAICLDYGSSRLCFPRCESVTDCRAGYNCFVARTGDTPERACFPFCTSDAQCPGSACNTYSRFCSMLDTSRADNGATCTRNLDCRSGRCFEEFNETSSEPTGYLDGLCYSRCTVPAASEYAGSTYPRGDCPANSVCVREAGQVAGQTALCRGSCGSTSDCRPGYICLKPSRGADAGTYDNGYCAPLNCHYMAQTCPSDATCQTTRSDDAGVPTSGFCTRPMRSDAGATDAATDATASDATATDATADTGATDAGASD